MWTLLIILLGLLMAKLTLNTIGSRYGSIDALNDNSDLIETAFENTLSRDGTNPNNMESDLDMDSNDIINVANLSVASLRVNGQPVSPGSINYTGQVKETQTATSGQTVFNLSTVSYAPLTNNLSVYVDGVYQNPTTYTENNSTRITFDAGVHIGAVVDFVVLSLTDLPGTTDASNVTYSPAGSGAVTTTVETKLRETVSVKDFGAVGDGVTDDTVAIQNAIDASAGKVVHGIGGENYRITSGLTIFAARTVLDLNGATLTADFSSGYAITIGDGIAILDGLGVKNGHITTNRSEVTLNGVLYNKNVRRNIAYTDLRITNFKGTGLRFEQLNWSTQGAFNPLIENCGVNLHLDDNANGLAVVGAHLKNADTYNLVLRGAFAVTFVGGGNENAGVAGVYIDNGSVGSLQSANSVTFDSVYFEDNGTSHIIANNGRGLVVKNCYINCDYMTGVAIDINSWTGATIQANNVNNTSGRDFVNADSSSVLICVGRQAVSSPADQIIGGSMSAYVSDNFPNPVTSLPTASTLNRGAQFLLTGSGTGANRDTPWICTTIASGSRAFRRMALQPVKQSAQSVASPFTPSIANFQCFDLTIGGVLFTINAPTGPYDDGDEIIFLFRQNAAPVASIAWDAVYKTDLSTTLLANAFGSVTFRWSAGRSFWIQTGKLEWTV